MPFSCSSSFKCRSRIVEYLKCYKNLFFHWLVHIYYGMHLWIGIFIFIYYFLYVCVYACVFLIFPEGSPYMTVWTHFELIFIPMTCFISSSIRLLEIRLSLHHIQKRLVILHREFSAVIAMGFLPHSSPPCLNYTCIYNNIGCVDHNRFVVKLLTLDCDACLLLHPFAFWGTFLWLFEVFCILI